MGESIVVAAASWPQDRSGTGLPTSPIDPSTSVGSGSFGDRVQEVLDTVGGWPWIDLCGLVLAFGFLLLGLRHGFGWQFARLIAVVLAFVGAAAFGPEVGRLVGPTVVPSDPVHAAPLLGSSLVFLALLLVSGMLFGLFRRRPGPDDEVELDTGPGFGSRLLGAGLGIVTGTALGVAVLLFVHVSARVMDFGNSWVVAAEPSHSRALGLQASEALRRWMPSDFREGAAVLHQEFRSQGGTGAGEGDPLTGDRFGADRSSGTPR